MPVAPKALSAEEEEAMRTRFDQMPCYTFRVPEQHNHSDCGLYMLKFIEVIATRLDELQSPIWELRDWKKHPALMGKSVSHTAHLPHPFSTHVFHTRFPHPFSTPVSPTYHTPCFLISAHWMILLNWTI